MPAVAGTGVTAPAHPGLPASRAHPEPLRTRRARHRHLLLRPPGGSQRRGYSRRDGGSKAGAVRVPSLRPTGSRFAMAGWPVPERPAAGKPRYTRQAGLTLVYDVGLLDYDLGPEAGWARASLCAIVALETNGSEIFGPRVAASRHAQGRRPAGA